MRNVKITLLALLFGAVSVVAANPVDGVKEVDVAKSTITWEGKKVTGSHNGTIMLQGGSLTMADGMLTAGHFVIDMTSIKNSDMAGSDGAGKLEGHLKSPDFFGVEQHPTSTLQFTQVVHRGTEGSYKVIADLTIKGITKPVKFNAQFSEEEGMKIATADIVVDRSDYDVRYGSGSFFDNLGDKTIYDEFTLVVKLVLK